MLASVNLKAPPLKTSWFERNPYKTFIGLFCVFLLVLTIVLETTLGFLYKTKEMKFPRYIRLRECEPNYQAMVIPSDNFLKMTDNLPGRSYLFRIDQHGFIMPSLIHPDPDITMVFLGGSTTECLYNDEEKRFPFLTGRLLEQYSGLKINSINASRGGNNSFHSLNILLNKILPFKPQIAIIMHNINDLTTLIYGSYWDLHTERSQIVYVYPEIISLKKILTQYLLPNIYLALKTTERTIRKKLFGKSSTSLDDDEFKQVRGKLIKLDPFVLATKFSMSLHSFVEICRAWQITPILMTQANRLKDHPDEVIQTSINNLKNQGITYQIYKEAYEVFNQAIRTVGQEKKVMVIDLAREVPQEREYMYDLVHFTNWGSEYVAQLLANQLLPLIKSYQPGVN